MKRKESDDRRQEVEGKLIALSAMEQKELFEKYEVDEYGLDPVQASDRLDEYGRNIIDFGKEKSLAVRIKDAIINPFNIVLLVVAVIAVTLLIGFTGISSLFGLPTMPIIYMAWLAGLMVVYTLFAQFLKTLYIKKHKDWL